MSHLCLLYVHLRIEENSNGRRNRARERSRLLLNVVCISIALLGLQRSSAEGW